MIHKFFTAICLMTALSLAGCGSPQDGDGNGDKNGKTEKTEKTGKTAEENGKTPEKTMEKTGAEKTTPMPDEDEPVVVPEDETDDSGKAESGSTEK